MGRGSPSSSMTREYRNDMFDTCNEKYSLVANSSNTSVTSSQSCSVVETITVRWLSSRIKRVKKCSIMDKSGLIAGKSINSISGVSSTNSRTFLERNTGKWSCRSWQGAAAVNSVTTFSFNRLMYATESSFPSTRLKLSGPSSPDAAPQTRIDLGRGLSVPQYAKIAPFESKLFKRKRYTYWIINYKSKDNMFFELNKVKISVLCSGDNSLFFSPILRSFISETF